MHVCVYIRPFYQARADSYGLHACQALQIIMAQACARLCHQRRHLLNDVGGNGESGESGESV